MRPKDQLFNGAGKTKTGLHAALSVAPNMETTMHRRKLGLNGPEVGAIGLGCMGMSDFYGYADRAGSIATIHAALVVRMIEAKILPACRELGIGITASGVLARGSSPAIGRRSRQNRRISAPPPQASPAAISTTTSRRLRASGKSHMHERRASPQLQSLGPSRNGTTSSRWSAPESAGNGRSRAQLIGSS